MGNFKKYNTNDAYNLLLSDHVGGGFTVSMSSSSIDTTKDQTAVIDYKGSKLFSIAIYNQKSNKDKVSLAFMINPSDITIGQTFIASDSYTRSGWLSTLWGKSQPTIMATGSTAAFYIDGMGLTTISRKRSLSFRNFISFLAIFKNNGHYFLSGPQNIDLFGNDPGRVISVMDLVKISYDGVDYIGSFSSLTVEESVENPFNFTFNFEFIVSGLRQDKVDGHLMDDSAANNVKDIILATSGKYGYDQIISLDTTNDDINFVQYTQNTEETSGKAATPLGDQTPSAPVHPKSISTYNALILATSAKTGIDSSLISAVILSESSGDPYATSDIKNSAGKITGHAYGLMQMTPGTAEGYSITDPTKLYDPSISIQTGTEYLKSLIKTYTDKGYQGNDAVTLALEAYNWGQGHINSYLSGKITSIPPEVQLYATKILNNQQKFKNTQLANGANSKTITNTSPPS